MEPLFTKAISTNGQSSNYSVSFHDDQYFFESKDGAQPFSLRREDDEWHTHDNIGEELKDEAVAVLEEYLLSQH